MQFNLATMLRVKRDAVAGAERKNILSHAEHGSEINEHGNEIR